MNYEQKEEVLKDRFADKRSLEYATPRIVKRRNVAMRTCSVLGLAILATGLSGCMIVDSPIKGVLGTEVTWGDIATGKAGSAEIGDLKMGKACAESILGLLARGDASVRAAKDNGDITEVISVDHSARNFLNIVGEWCTIVRGR
ncbi:MAG: TRL-like family protein [Gammaproteobacteria bacterium]